MEKTETTTLHISSPVFGHELHIPSEYSCEGDNISPPLQIDELPDGTESLAMIVEDPDAPHGNFTHLVAWNIPPAVTIEENGIKGVIGQNDIGRNEYTGPCPPTGTHRYFFKVYALDTQLTLSTDSKKEALEHAMEGHILAVGEIVGLYKKK